MSLKFPRTYAHKVKIEAKDLKTKAKAKSIGKMSSRILEAKDMSSIFEDSKIG